MQGITVNNPYRLKGRVYHTASYVCASMHDQFFQLYKNTPVANIFLNALHDGRLSATDKASVITLATA